MRFVAVFTVARVEGEPQSVEDVLAHLGNELDWVELTVNDTDYLVTCEDVTEAPTS